MWVAHIDHERLGWLARMIKTFNLNYKFSDARVCLNADDDDWAVFDKIVVPKELQEK